MPAPASSSRRVLRFLVAVAIFVGPIIATRYAPRRAMAAPAMAGMSDADMARHVAEWFAAHPAHGQQSTASPTDSFFVANDFFDEDHDGAATQVDTAVIFQGQTVLWKWVVGMHTITSGTSGSDPNAGALFDVPSTASFTTFSFQFNSPGVVPFFCRNHEPQNMRGFVRVQSTASVEPIAGPHGAGFTAPPWPNPSRGTTVFRFSLPMAGHARATIHDVSGRRVATPLDRDLGAGTWAGAWDGRTGEGSPAPAGVYLVTLEVPGATQTRRIALER
jgi:plastocyanin